MLWFDYVDYLIKTSVFSLSECQFGSRSVPTFRWVGGGGGDTLIFVYIHKFVLKF